MATSTPLPRERGERATNPTEAPASKDTTVEAELQNEEDNVDRNPTGSQEDNEEPEAYFGDFPGRVHEGQVRIGFANIYGIPADADHPKNTTIRESINYLGANIIGLAETNLHWKKLPGKDRWDERSRGWWDNSKHVISYNTLSSPQFTHQPGGTLSITRGDTSFRVISQGCDKSNMGRWSWTLISGRRGVTTRIITAYRPCASKGLKSTYMQHKRVLDAKKINTCPRKHMLDELCTALTAWIESGNQIILLIDLNEDVINSSSAKKLNDLGLQECITNRHTPGIIPPTCIKGSRPIDGIFISQTLHISQGGYLPFSCFPSDHRALWIDVSMSNLCGNTMAPIRNPAARRLKCNDPTTQKKWLNLYISYLESENAIKRAYTLQTVLQPSLPFPQDREYEKIRIIRMQARQYADKKCRKLRMGAVPYSLELAAARSMITLWKAIVSWKLGGKTNMKYLQRLEKKNNVTNSRYATLKDAKEKLSEAFSKYWSVKKEAHDLRLKFLEKKATELATDNDLEPANIYKQLITREAQRTTARKIKSVLRRVQGNGVTKVSLLNDRGEWVETTGKLDIEKGCAKENATKFRQTENTPCMNGQLAEDLGFLGNTPSADAILEGRYQPPPGTSQFTAEFLHHLQYDVNAKVAPPLEIVTTSDYTSGWKNKKEQISAGKSGWTFSHSKTCALNKTTADFEATMAHIPYVTGYAPKEWKVGVNIMIYKKVNMDRVDKLRTIVLKEADANFNDGKLGRDMMRHAEDKQMIAKEQYGSRKGHCSIDHAVNKRLTFDLFRLSRSPGALCSNDAKSCYDRILHSIASLAMRRLGIPLPPIECMLTCIQQMDHFIRTTHGDSDISYSSKHTAIPFQGVLQGNGAAPSIWVAVSTPLLNMMRTAKHGLQMTSAITKEKSNIVGYAFVDDTDLVQGNIMNHSITAEEVMEEMQMAILRWEGGLKATGGALVPSKSFVYPIDFKFDRAGRAHYKSVEEIGGHFQAPNADGTITQLEQLEPTESRETLGVFLSPDGTNDEAASQLRKKASEWSNLVLTGHLSVEDVRRAMDTTVIKSLEYPLPALTLTEKQCHRIMAPVLQVTLPKTRVCRTFPRAVVYGPKGTLGLGINNLYLVQGSKHIALLHQFLDTDTITGDLLRNSIELTKMYVGHGENLFSLDFSRLGRLTPPTWISHLWGFCHKFKIKIEDGVTSNLTPKRLNDKFIMQEIAQHREFSNTELVHINRCRMHLKVMTISDIANGNGQLLRHGVLKGQMMQLDNPTLLWPRQDRPGIRSWRIWRKAVKRIFMRQIKLHLKPEYLLGGWNDGNSENWNWFFVPQTQRVYQRLDSRWKTYQRQGRGSLGTASPFTYLSDAIGLPPLARRCSVFRDSHGKLRLSGSSRELPQQDRRTHKSCTMLDNIFYKGNVTRLLQSIRDGKAKAVSDGSFLQSHKLGTAAFVVEGETTGDLVQGSHETPGSKSSQCAHRSEMFGIFALILMVNALCTKNDIQEGHITAKCDGEGTIKILHNLHVITKNTRKHFDLIIAITKALNKSPLTWTFAHIDGHQDDHVEFNRLDRWAQLNVMVDKERSHTCCTYAFCNNSTTTIRIPTFDVPIL
jgi:hypothetical protein